jgi:transcriptional regulator with XRE-family HTH domain
MQTNSTTPRAKESLGALLQRARIGAGMSYGTLAAATGIARGQLHKLEHDQVQKVNPAQLAVLASPLGLSLYDVYAAAGYQTPSELMGLGADLEDKLRRLPPDALGRLEAYVDRLMRDDQRTAAPGNTTKPDNAT